MPRILVVEDDEHLGRGSNSTCRRRLRCRPRARGETAVAMAVRQPFDLITLDVMLPGMTGWTSAGNSGVAG